MPGRRAAERRPQRRGPQQGGFHLAHDCHRLGLGDRRDRADRLLELSDKSRGKWPRIRPQDGPKRSGGRGAQPATCRMTGSGAKANHGVGRL